MQLPPQLVTVTPLSKALALLLFILLPVAAFGFGIAYQQRVDQVHSSLPIASPSVTLAPSPTPTSATTVPLPVLLQTHSPSATSTPRATAAASPFATPPCTNTNCWYPPSGSLTATYLANVSASEMTWLRQQYPNLDEEVSRVLKGSTPSKCSSPAPSNIYVCYPACSGAADISGSHPTTYTWQTVDQILSPCS